MLSQFFLKLWQRDLPLLHVPRALQEFYAPKLKLRGFFFPPSLEIQGFIFPYLHSAHHKLSTYTILSIIFPSPA